MSGPVEASLTPAMGEILDALGVSVDPGTARDQAAAAARGSNLALAYPPAARYALPAMAGLITALRAGSRALVLVPPHALGEWSAVLLPLAAQAGVPALSADQPTRAARALRGGQLQLLLTSPATALALLERSALKAEDLAHLVLVWPDLYESDQPLAALMQDMPAESHRIIVLAEPRPGHPLLERYARRAFVTGPLADTLGPESMGPAVRVVPTGWERRREALGAVLEALDPASVSVWCADARSAEEARVALPVGDPEVRVVTGDAPAASLVIGWDLPSPARMAQLRSAGELVLLVPPHALGYLTRVSRRWSVVRVRTAADVAREDTTRHRMAIEAELTQADLEGPLLALAPLFERHDAATVAAALYRMWRARPAEAAPAEAPATTETARVWVGVGKKDGAGPADLVAALTREVGVEAARIGRIELRELFSLVEVPADQAEQIARGLSGKTIRRRQVVAKVDRGRPARSRQG